MITKLRHRRQVRRSLRLIERQVAVAFPRRDDAVAVAVTIPQRPWLSTVPVRW